MTFTKNNIVMIIQIISHLRLITTWTKKNHSLSKIIAGEIDVAKSKIIKYDKKLSNKSVLMKLPQEIPIITNPLRHLLQVNHPSNTVTSQAIQ
jgi:hypothetical protein